MVTTFQPFLLVTTDVTVANKFISIENTGRNINRILNEIDSNENLRRSILISPTKNNSYFESFDYNIGYDTAETFSINLNFIGVDAFFEEFFIKFIFSEEKYRKIVEANNIEKKLKSVENQIQNISDFSDPTVFSEKDILGLLNPKNTVKDIDNVLINKIENYCYFIFGVNEKISTPIVAQFRSCEVSQGSDGFKKLKANFLNLGHPGNLTDLSLLNIKSPEFEVKETYEQEQFSVGQVYKYEGDVDLSELVDKGLLSQFIRQVLTEVFYKVTGGQDVILLLPDFDKLFQKYSSSPRNVRENALSVGKDSLIEFRATIASSKIQKYLKVTEFLKYLGFILDTDWYKKIQQRDARIPEGIQEDIKKFESQSDDLVAELKADGYSEDTIRQLMNSTGSDLLNNESSIKQRLIRESKANIFSVQADKGLYKYALSMGGRSRIQSIYDQLLKRKSDYGELLLKLSESDEIDLGEGFWSTTGELAVKSDYYAKNYQKALLKLYQEDIAPPAGKNANQTGHHQQDQMNSIPESVKKIKIIFSIVKNKNGDVTTELVPVKGTNINFYKFLAEFSTKISELESNYPIRIKFYEENDLKRLDLLKNCFRKVYPPSGKVPLTTNFNNTIKPALVIGDEFLIKNLFYPVTTTKQNWDDYPTYQEDLENYGIDSKYFKDLQNYRDLLKKQNQGVINSFFNESFLDSDVLDIVKSLQDPKRYKDLLPYAPPIFLANSPRANVISYEVEVDKLNNTIAYTSILEYLKTGIVIESLEPLRRSLYDVLFDVPYLKRVVTQSLADGQDIQEIQDAIVNEAQSPTSNIWKLSQTFGKELDIATQLETKSNREGQNAKLSDYLLKYLIEDLLMDLTINSSTKVSRSILTDIKYNPLLIRKQILDDLYKKLFKVRVKTLPFFNINNMERVHSGAFFVAKNVLRPDETLLETQQFSYLTGLYFILGFRHIITTSSAYSEFTLCKSVDMEGPQK